MTKPGRCAGPPGPGAGRRRKTARQAIREHTENHSHAELLDPVPGRTVAVRDK